MNGIPQNPGTVKRFLTKSELDDLRKKGFTFDPNDTRGGLSITSKKVNPVDGDGLKESTGALDADHWVVINTKGKNVELKGKTKGGLPDWKIKDNITPDDIMDWGRVKK